MSAASSSVRRNPRPSPRPTGRSGGRLASATRAATARATANAPERSRSSAVPVRATPRTKPDPAAARRAQLRVVDAPVPRRRLVVFGAGLAAVLLFGSLFALAAFHTLIVQGQLQMDTLDRSIDDAQAHRTELRFLVADLSSPQRILDEAERLHMVQPQDPVYLQPVTPGGPVGVPLYSSLLTETRTLQRPVVTTTTLPSPTTTVPTATTVAGAATKTTKAAR